MATRTQSRQSTRTSSNRSSGRSSSASRSAFSWGDGAGPIVGAAIAGAAIGLAANYGRKALMQGMEAAAGDWDEILAAEHDMALAIFDKMLGTDETQTFKRKMLLMKLTHALDKHAHQEEMVVYPALRDANESVSADQLEGEHGYIKTFIYELNEMGPDSSNWLEKVREFRSLVSRHAHMEEEEVFPSFKQALDENQNARITSLVNRDGSGWPNDQPTRASFGGSWTERSTLPSPVTRSMRAASSASSA
jgi:hemerythrin superfamily protein